MQQPAVTFLCPKCNAKRESDASRVFCACGAEMVPQHPPRKRCCLGRRGREL